MSRFFDQGVSIGETQMFDAEDVEPVEDVEETEQLTVEDEVADSSVVEDLKRQRSKHVVKKYSDLDDALKRAIEELEKR